MPNSRNISSVGPRVKVHHKKVANVVIVSQGLLYVKSLATLSHIFLTLFIPPLGIVLQGQLWLLQRYILLWYNLWNIFFKKKKNKKKKKSSKKWAGAILCLALYVHTTNIFENVRGPSHTIPVIPISVTDLSCIARIQYNVACPALNFSSPSC